MSNVQQQGGSAWKRVWSALKGSMPRLARFLLTALVPILLSDVIFVALEFSLFLLLPSAFWSVSSLLGPPPEGPLSPQVVWKLTAFHAFLGLLFFATSWFVSSRRWAVAGRYACPLFPLLGGFVECIRWLRQAVSAGDILAGATIFIFCTVGSFVGGYLGDRRRPRARPPAEPHRGGQ